MNLCFLTVQISSLPLEYSKQNDVSFIKFKGLLSKLQRNKGFDILDIYIWGSLSETVIKNYRIGDYIVIEGILSYKYTYLSNNQPKKQMIFTIFNICPVLLET